MIDQPAQYTSFLQRLKWGQLKLLLALAVLVMIVWTALPLAIVPSGHRGVLGGKLRGPSHDGSIPSIEAASSKSGAVHTVGESGGGDNKH